jgi:hypothetical protein
MKTFIIHIILILLLAEPIFDEQYRKPIGFEDVKIIGQWEFTIDLTKDKDKL